MPEPKTRPAHLADLISIYTGRVCTVDGTLVGVKRVLEFMVNRQLLDVQMGRAADTVKPALAAQFPWLPSLTLPDVKASPGINARDTVHAWVDQVAAEHGLIHRVQRLPEGAWEDKDPLAEYRSHAAPDATVIAVMPTAGSIETFTNPPAGVFRNPPLDEGDDQGR
jgi:hypothetical protein